jgi:hypothetical protein
MAQYYLGRAWPGIMVTVYLIFWPKGPVNLVNRLINSSDQVMPG